MQFREKYTIAQAAKLLGYSNKSTVTKHRLEGRFTASKGDDGAYYIEHAELERAYPDRIKKAKEEIAVGDDGSSARTTSNHRQEPSNIGKEFIELSVEVKFLREQVDDLKENLEHERQGRAEDRELLKMLTHQPELEEESSSGWWPFRRSKKNKKQNPQGILQNKEAVRG